MKFKKITIALILAFSVILPGAVEGAAAYNSYLFGKCVNIGAIEFSAAGELISVLPTEGFVTVSTKLKKAAGADTLQQVSIVAAAYKNSVLIRTSVNSVTLADAYTTVLSAEIGVNGADELRAYVCDNLDNGRPLSARAVFGSKAIELETIFVGDDELEDFSADKTEYAITVSAGYLTFPEVKPKIKNAGVQSEISYSGSFPLELEETATAELKLTSQDGATSKTYTIIMKQEEAAVTNAVSAAATVGIKTGLSEPSFISEPSAPISDSALTDGYGANDVIGHALYTDRVYPFIFIPANLVGSTVVSTNVSYKNDYHFNKGNDTLENGISFDINRTATVYMVVSNFGSEWISREGFVTDTSIKISWISQNNTQGRLFTDNSVVKKTIEVKPGETVTVRTGPIAYGFIDFSGGNIVSRANLKKSESEGRELTVLKKLYNADYYTELHPKYTGNLDNYKTAVGFISDRPTYYSTDFPEELLDAEGIAFPLNFRVLYSYAGNPENMDAVTFDVNCSSDVYVFYPAEINDMPWMISNGFTELDDDSFRIKYVWGSNSAYTQKVFKKRYDVQPGETVRVELGGFPAAKGSNIPLMVVVDRVEG